MKAYSITSPAYRANGLNGTYQSIAFCDNDGNFVKIIGDHANGMISESFFFPRYKNIKEIEGLSFTDEDRLITTHEINVDMKALEKWEKEYWAKTKGVSWYDFLKTINKLIAELPATRANKMKRTINLKDNLSKESIEFLFQNFSIADEKLSFVASKDEKSLVLNQDGSAKVYIKGNMLEFKSYQDAVDFLQI